MDDTNAAIDVKEAIRRAKTVFGELFEGEPYNHLGLEEVSFDAHKGHWIVTLGLNRPWDVKKKTIKTESAAFLIGRSFSPSETVSEPIRTLKRLRIHGQSGDFVAMEDA